MISGRARGAWALAFGLLVGVAPLARAQRAAGPRPELRLEAIVSRHTSVQAGVGVNAAAGTYLRWGLVAAAGATQRDGRTVATWRADVVVRFLLDPFRESPRGVYGLSGISTVDDGSRHVKPAVFVGAGIEGRPHGAVIPAVELALGGGARVAFVVRRTRPGRR